MISEDDFKTISLFGGYISKPEITNVKPSFLVKGSKNVLIDYANHIVSRLGYTLFGAANNGGTKIVSSYDWATSTGKEFGLRTTAGRLEFYWNNAWNLLKSGYATSDMAFAKVWDDTEKFDVLIYVMGDTNYYKWSGGVSKVASSTSTTLTKQGVMTSKTTIAFVAGVANTTAATITDSGNGFLTAGFAAGDTLYVTGSAANSRNFTIGSVTAGTITLIMSDVLTNESAGPSITIHNGEATWQNARFIANGTRKILYNGTEYAYTGGETTDTLTGLTSFPTVTAGDTVWQTAIVTANPVAIPAYFKADLVGVQLNQLIFASTKSREIYISKNTDYTNFTLTSPRAPADPAMVIMDDYATCIVPLDNIAQTTSSIIFGGGKDEFFQLSYQLSQDNTTELVRMIKFKTANGSGLLAKGAITSIKDSTAYISREPALDILANVQNSDKKDMPLSDLIKNDFDNYNFTNAHVKYWKRSIYIALPSEGLVLIYDLMRNLWQPPQTIPVSRLAVIGDWLYGHSSITNETYKLFDGNDDNGNFINQVARFAYNNGGNRSLLKTMTEQWSDGYITPGGVLNINLYFGFNGADGIKNFTLSGNDSKVADLPTGSPLGSEPMGSLDGLPDPELDLSLPGMVRFWQIDTMPLIDFTEMFVEYTMNTLDARFALVAYGNNMMVESTSPVSHKK